MRVARGQSDILQERLGSAPALFLPYPGFGHRQLHVLERRENGHEIETLKHEPDVLEPKTCRLAIGQSADTLAIDCQSA